MKNLNLLLLLFLGVLLNISCVEKEKHFLKDEAYRKQVHEQFEKRTKEAANRSEALFSVFKKDNLSLEQREALEFLYAYMPLCDLADYDGDFFLNQVDAAFKARDYFTWDKIVPDDIFRHFVLVYRVNNEYLDTARTVFFEELKDRIKNLSMYDAALEVNHWCHEKVTYRGTDGRTSAPLALIRTSWGRCGEESTFTASAMRAVGIPARQCYTPRWVHTDDNHAWVEVWVDGKWHYLGACEPEPELDAAWFTGPAKRAMMVHTNVFGLYNGPEEKNLETPLYSKINLLENYAETRTVKVQVTDENNLPVEGARVRFQVYNYAELYPIAESVTGKNGEASIISGKGDLMIWASKDDVYGYQKSEPKDEITVVKLNRRSGEAYSEDFVMNVPPEKPVTALSPEKVVTNAVRLAHEDSIRNAYMNTFISKEQAYRLAEENQLNKDEAWKYLNLSQGNWQEISNFIIKEKANPDFFPYLATLSAKDLRDTPADYLVAHLQNREIKESVPKDMIVRYILSPRIESELIKPWNFSSFSASKDIQSIIDYVNRIILNDDENYYNCRITPQGAYELGITDSRSRNVFFVALCRNFGIPARLEPATYKPQYFENGKWIDVYFQSETAPISMVQVNLTAQNAKENIIKPSYSANYSLAYFKDGDFHTLDFEGNPSVANFPYTLKLDAGYYRLMVGSRANDGSVFIHTEYFELKENTDQTVSILIPETEGKLLVKGIIDMNSIILKSDGSKATLKELSRGKGLVLCFLDHGKEPSKHILQDFPAVQTALEQWGGGVLFMIPDDKAASAFDASSFKGLPVNTTWGSDRQRELLKSATGALQIDFKDNFPLTVYLSSNGGILFSSVGYRIGTGTDILTVIQKELKTK
jgi:transglutaminase-like putative cysteine protease